MKNSFFLSFMSLARVSSTEWHLLTSSIWTQSVYSSQVTRLCIYFFYTYFHILSFARLLSTHADLLMPFLGFLLLEMNYFSGWRRWPLQNQPRLSWTYFYFRTVFHGIPSSRSPNVCQLEIQACDPAVSFFFTFSCGLGVHHLIVSL